MVRISTRRRKPKKSQTHKRYRYRKQRGGVPPLNALRFRYTERPERGEWVDAIYPLAPIVLELMRRIDWSTYRFEGETVVKVFPESASNNNRGFTLTQIKPYEATATVTASSPPPTTGVPYHIFGGSACELWNQAYPDAGNLHETTDPTADIDILVARPYCIVHGKHSDSAELLYIDKNGNYTPLADSYTSWIYNMGIQLATTLAPLFSPKIFVPPDKIDMSETSVADMEQTIGPILVTRSYVNNMIKIQLSTKLKIGYADHFIEFIVTTNESFESGKSNLRGTLLNGVYVENARELFTGQLKGLHDRKNIPIPIVYKLINHYGRLLYLAKLHEYTIRMKLQPEEAAYYYKEIIEFINKGGFNPSPGCIPRVGCSLEEFVKPLCKILTFNIAYGKCAIPMKYNIRRNIKFTENNNNEE